MLEFFQQVLTKYSETQNLKLTFLVLVGNHFKAPNNMYLNKNHQII